MTRILLLTSDGSISDGAVAEIAERAAREPVEAHVVVPLRPTPDAWAWDEDATRAATLTRLDEAMARLRATGALVEGTVGCDRDPMVCVNWVMDRERFDEVVVATPRSARARWLRMDLPARIRRAFGVPVTSAVLTRDRPAMTS